MDPGAYCRHVEAYLCARNQGHLIRIVGPAFELVNGWSAAGIPLSVVRRAVDTVCARQRARGRRRRPIRIEFCEADVLDLFDDWKRAVGVGVGLSAPAADPDAGGEGSAGAVRRRSSLAAHLERAATRLAAWAGAGEAEALARSVAAAAAELDAARPGEARPDPGEQVEAGVRAAAGPEAGGAPRSATQGARGGSATLRGRARQQLITRLAELDAALLAAAREGAGESLRRRLRDDAAREMAPFRDRMEPGAFRRAVDAGADRLLVEHFDLPRLTYD